MEYFIGSLVTIITIITFGKLFSKKIEPVKDFSVGYTQSFIHEVVKSSLPEQNVFNSGLVTQSTQFNKELYHRVIITGDFAYWISNNQFFFAPVEDGMIKKDFARLVDTMSMNSVELEKMTFIVDRLTEGDTAK